LKNRRRRRRRRRGRAAMSGRGTNYLARNRYLLHNPDRGGGRTTTLAGTFSVRIRLGTRRTRKNTHVDRDSVHIVAVLEVFGRRDVPVELFVVLIPRHRVQFVHLHVVIAKQLHRIAHKYERGHTDAEHSNRFADV